MKKAFPALLALLCACLALLVATSSSPLYATNFWTDTNIYFTIGRGMTRGLMPYRDLFDHKGPLLFILYALGAAISDTSFIGVFALEALQFCGGGVCGLEDGTPVWRRASNAAGYAAAGGGDLLLHGVHTGRKRGGICAACAGRWRLFDAGGDDAGGGKDARAHAGLRRGGGLGVPDQIHGHRSVCRAGVCLLAFVWRREGFGRALLAAGRMLLGAALVCAPRRRIWRSTVRWARASRFISCRTCLITAACR